MNINYKITVVGAGYVGLSSAVLLAQHNQVTLVEVLSSKVDLINNGQSPIDDNEIADFLLNKTLNLIATTDINVAYIDADFIIVAVPTNYDEKVNYFDTQAIENVISDILKYNLSATIIIKSTIPVGYIDKLREKFNYQKIIFSPEFLREGKALYDNLYPSRIIIGDSSDNSKIFASLMVNAAIKNSVPVLFTGSTEAEAIKLFSNAYLAMRVAYFNELDTYCGVNNMQTKDIIEGVGLDPRIGSHYNNPSFGYGGYCFPKDTKQLKANFKDIPNSLISAIIDSNQLRKEFIVKQLVSLAPKVLGIYRLIMKSDSDNIRYSAILDIIDQLKAYDIKVIIYEPIIKESIFKDVDVINDINLFKDMCDVIVANRVDSEINDVINKVYTRDIFNNDI